MAISSRAISGDWNGNVFIDSLLYGAWKWQSVYGPTEPTIIGVYFSNEGLRWTNSELPEVGIGAVRARSRSC